MENLVPKRAPVGKAHIICEQDKYTIKRSGKVVTKGLYDKPFNGDALAHALRFHGFPGIVVEVKGNHHQGIQLNNPNVHMPSTVLWSTSGPVGNVTLIGTDPEQGAKIGGVHIFDKTGDIRIENVTLMNPGGDFCTLLVHQHAIVGNIKLYDIKFLPMDPNAWGGKGMKWNLRGHGSAKSWDCRNLKFHKAVEHGAYIDNHQGDSYFVKCVGGGMGRTMIQITNRVESGPNAKGMLVIANCIADGVGGEGGSDYTIVGNGESPIYFVNNKSLNGKHGAFVHWTDKGHGAYLTSNGFSSHLLVIHNFEVNSPNADRDHIMISGVEHAFISQWHVTGNQGAIGINTPFGGGIDNGNIYLVNQGIPPSQARGWKSLFKMRDGNELLTDDQIDTLVYHWN